MFGEFVWFIGVIEDRNDPEMKNRVRVRCHGYHTPNKSLLPTEDLPWATVMMPVTSSGNSGVFESPHGLLEASWVLGFFRDGHDAQDPVILGSLASSYSDSADAEAAAQNGFSDPNGVYPLTRYVGNSDVNEHARGVETDIVVAKKGSVKQNVETASGASWSEPETPYSPSYPKNHVRETESGHLQELDDTPGSERIHEYHKSGTFREVHPDGSQVTRVVGNGYEIVAGDGFAHVSGSVKLTIDTNCDTYIKGDWNIRVDGNVFETIRKNKITNIGGAHELTAPTGTLVYENGSIVVKQGNITDTEVTLNSHKHSQGLDAADNSQADTNSPISGT